MRMKSMFAGIVGGTIAFVAIHLLYQRDWLYFVILVISYAAFLAYIFTD